MTISRHILIFMALGLMPTAPLAWAGGVPTDADGVFAERFDGPPSPRWALLASADPPGLRWSRPDERPGFHFTNSGQGYAVASWNVGTRPMEMAWEVVLDRGVRQDWRYPGVWVGLASAPPGKMTSRDIAIVIAVHQAGVTASVRRPVLGEVYEPNVNATGYPKAYSRMGDRDLSPRGVLNVGGAGGHFYSIQWPTTDLGGTHLRMQMRRDADGVLTMSVSRPDYKDGREPWWSGRWQMTPEAAAVPLRYVVVKLVHNPVDPEKLKSQPKGDDVISGTVGAIRARVLAVSAPEIAAVKAAGPVLATGAVVTVKGSGFLPGAAVEVGGKPASQVTVIGEGELRAMLPALAAGRRHDLCVINPNGLWAEAPTGLACGRWLERVEPREALPQGGDIVTVSGGGFEKGTFISFAGKPGEIVEIVDAGQVRVRVPAGAQGRAAVAAVTGGEVFAGSPDFGYAGHPYLFFRADELAGLRRKFGEPAFADYRKAMLAMADGVPIGGADTEKSGKAGIQSLLWAYLLTGDAAYKSRLMEVLAAEWDDLRHTEFRMMAAADMAMAYDAIFAELTPAERTKLQRYLERAAGVYVAETGAGRWWYGCGANGSNTVAVGAAGGGMSGLALMHSTPVAAEAARRAPEMVRKWYKAISPDGGCVEGSLYWNYGLSHQLMLGHAIAGATGDAQGLLDTPVLRRNVRFVETQLGGDGNLFTFNDTQPWLTGVSICADFGSRFDQPLMRWMADYMARQMATAGAAKEARGPLWQAFLWRDRTPAPRDFPGVPTLAKLDVMNWGVMRSDASFTPRLVVGVKGHGGDLTHHAQQDLGSFVLQARGEAFLIDPGYYQPKDTAHTLPLVDGKGPGDGRGAVAASPIAAACESGPWRSMTVDPTAACQKQGSARRVRRIITMCGDAAVVVLDDIVAAEGQPGKVTAQFQCGFKAEVGADKRSASIQGKRSRLWILTFGPVSLGGAGASPAMELRAVGPNDWGRSWIFRSTGVEWYSVTGEYIADAAAPLVTVLVPAGPADGPPQVEVRRRGDSLEVHLGEGRTARFAKAADGWQCVHP